MRKVAVITGVTSFLGRSIAKYLLSKGFIVFGIVRPDSEKKDRLSSITGLKTIEIDFDKLSSIDFDNFKIDYKSNESKNIYKSDITFLHFGWGSTLDRDNFMKQMLNVDYSMKVLEFAKRLSAKRFIFAGSQAEYSKSAYGLAKKRFADVAIKNLKDTDMKFIHYRIFSIYGKEDRENSLIKELVRCCKEDRDIDLSSCNYKWNFLYIDDFVKITYQFMTKDIETGTYDIASDDTRLLKDYCIEVKSALSSDILLNFGKKEDSKETFAVPHIDKMIDAIGKFRFTDFRDGIKLV
ncbi:MAG: NAD-dependent epimerase/dehydratase family protein [Lachnospiraceae bacterium]|nr:NAD-dependent epimerase/dehydratase family protein [Lachnospiraceae bacterium]